MQKPILWMTLKKHTYVFKAKQDQYIRWMQQTPYQSIYTEIFSLVYTEGMMGTEHDLGQREEIKAAWVQNAESGNVSRVLNISLMR